MMETDNSDVCCEWSQSEERGDPEEIQMERSHGSLLRESSISFGRFETDSLSWEKWSSFSQNRYLEEVEKFSTPGSVIQKKAYFEAHFKKIAARKALEQQQALEQQAQLESDSGTETSVLHEDHHLEEPSELPYQYNEENEEHRFAHPIEYDNSPHHTDTEEEILNTVNTSNGMSISQTQDRSEYLPPVMNNHEQENVHREDMSSSSTIVLEYDKEHCTLGRDTEVDAFNTMESEKTISCQDKLEHSHSPIAPQMEDRDTEEAQENEMASKHTLSESSKQKEKETLSLKDPAASKRQRAKVTHNKTSISIKTTSNGTSRTSKVQVSSGSNNSARGLSKASVKPHNGVAIGKKMADVDKTKRKTPTSLSRSMSPQADRRASTRQVLGDKKQASKVSLNGPTVIITSKTELQVLGAKKQGSKALPNGSTVVISSKTEPSTNGAPKTANVRAPHKEHVRNQKDVPTTQKKQMDKKQTELKNEGDTARSTSTGSRRCDSASRLDNKANGVGFSFKSDERAEKRREFYLKLEEKMNAKEAEMSEIQAKTQEEMEAKIKQLRRSLNFKATPMPTFYQEATSTKVETKKTPQNSTNANKLGKKSTNSGTDSDSSSVPTHKLVPAQGVKNNTSPSMKNKESQLDNSVTSSVNKAQKETGSKNLSLGKPIKSKHPCNGSPKREVINPAREEKPSAKAVPDGLKANVIETRSVNEESSQKSEHMSDEKTPTLISDRLLDARQEDLKNGAFVPSSGEHNGAEAKIEINNSIAESKTIPNTEAQVAVQNIDDAKEKEVAQKATAIKDKYNNTSSGSLSRIKPKSPRNASAGTSHESKEKAIKAAKHDRQKIAMPIEKGKRGSTQNASVKRGIKGNAGLACLIADVAVA